MTKLTIPGAVLTMFERIDPVTRQILLDHIYVYRVLGLAPDVSEEGEMIRYLWPLIVSEYARLDRQTKRTCKSRERYSNVTVSQEVPPSPKEKKSPHPLKEKDSSSPEELLDQAGLDRLFDRFWVVYPRKVGKSAAGKKFLAILRKSKEPIALVEKMIAAVKEQAIKLEWSKDRIQYIPHPLTWLNQGRWEDEVIAIGPERRNGQRKADNWIGTPTENLEEVF